MEEESELLLNCNSILLINVLLFCLYYLNKFSLNFCLIFTFIATVGDVDVKTVFMSVLRVSRSSLL